MRRGSLVCRKQYKVTESGLEPEQVFRIRKKTFVSTVSYSSGVNASPFRHVAVTDSERFVVFCDDDAE